MTICCCALSKNINSYAGHCTTVYGEWFGETAAGFQNRIDNPRYMFEVTDEGKFIVMYIFIHSFRVKYLLQ